MRMYVINIALLKNGSKISLRERKLPKQPQQENQSWLVCFHEKFQRQEDINFTVITYENAFL